MHNREVKCTFTTKTTQKVSKYACPSRHPNKQTLLIT